MTRPTGPVWGVVLAAGAGGRFGASKQFARAGGSRLVDLAVAATASSCDRVVVVLPAGRAWDGAAVDETVEGGSTRGASLRRALAVIPEAAPITVVHQAANPLASAELFEAVIGAVRAGAPAAVPGLRPPDVVRRVAGDHVTELVGRDDLVVVQTPGAFRTEVLRRAHAAGREAAEDTALVFALGEPVGVVAGDPRNVHVTTPDELDMVNSLLQGARSG